MKAFKFKTLQNRLIVALLLPVLGIMLTAGIFSFLYTRNAMLDQWNESAILKLQRAAHQIEMRLSKPLELMEMFYSTGSLKNDYVSQRWILSRLESFEGIVRVKFQWAGQNNEMESLSNHLIRMEDYGMMRFHHGELSKITKPRYDADAGYETVKVISSLINSSNQTVGKLEIVLSFDYLIKDIINLGWWQSDMACIVDQSGEYIMHTNVMMKDRQLLGETNNAIELMVLEEMKSRPYGTVKSAGHPPKTVAGFYSLEQAPWKIVVFAPGEKIFQPIVRYRNTFALGTLLIVLIILLLIRSHVSTIVQKIKSLSKSARQVANGEYGRPIKAESYDEIGQLVRSYNSMVEGLKERDLIRNTFGRYIDSDFAKELLNRPDAGKLGGQKRKVVIMMTDIRGFTPTVEKLSPEKTIYMLNHYLSHMIRVIQKHKGIIVDFVGDAILVFFEPMNDSLVSTVKNCIQCAFSMHNEMNLFNQEMTKEGLPELKMGIGINVGEVVVGNIGSKERAKYGIVGSAVNLTQRIQERAKGEEIVISDAVYKYVKDSLGLGKTFQAELKGINAPITLHTITGNIP